MSPYPQFDQVVFSGGGLRCFWQGGFLEEVRDRLPLEPARISGVSGGALTAAGFVTRRGQKVLETMCRHFAQNDTNLPDDIDAQGMSPHQQIYRNVIEEILDADAVSDVVNGPSFQVLIGHPPSGDFPRLSGTAATIAYEAELHTIASPHFDWSEKIGVESSLVDARQAAKDGKLADLICAAATIPPLFEPPTWNGREVIDGGMANQAPMPDPDKGDTLVLLTRTYSGLEPVEGRLYTDPNEETPADKIDFTDGDKLQKTWACGVKDGRRFLAQYTDD
ncbi:patatin-like phospholipase family protein [Salipiger sp. IMCC34102]|uniref:patatin-like phospholipase family protein n=1 Tax=Salipiger sp. IMCC34102 TaxID=2510647 RepID=UPI00101D8D80|nr:patatin-like phospholipase family protein [Salipiger sp. IMCC34102]RYH01994.1 patatin-like phospholipase family protein [Salipiger sp. IMCC34102]